VKTVDKLKQLKLGPVNFLDQLRVLPSTEIINVTIMSCVLSTIKEDGDVFVFCDVMERLCDEFTSKSLIVALRNGM